MVKKTPAYKNRLRALELERSGGTTNKKKTHKLTNKYDPVKSSLRVNNKISWMSFSSLDDVSINVDTSSFHTPMSFFRIILWVLPLYRALHIMILNLW